MTKKSRMLLNTISEFAKCENVSPDTSFTAFQDHVEIVEKPPRRRVDVQEQVQGEVLSTLQYLCENGCVEFVNPQSRNTFTLTHKGLNYVPVVWEDVRSLLIRSVAIPIVVSVITTLLVLLIKSLLA